MLSQKKPFFETPASYASKLRALFDEMAAIVESSSIKRGRRSPKKELREHTYRLHEHFDHVVRKVKEALGFPATQPEIEKWLFRHVTFSGMSPPDSTVLLRARPEYHKVERLSAAYRSMLLKLFDDWSGRTPPDWTWRKQLIQSRAKDRCEECGVKHALSRPLEFHAHHRILRSEGGSHEIENLRYLCENCHGKQPGLGHKAIRTRRVNRLKKKQEAVAYLLDPWQRKNWRRVLRLSATLYTVDEQGYSPEGFEWERDFALRTGLVEKTGERCPRPREEGGYGYVQELRTVEGWEETLKETRERFREATSSGCIPI